MINMLKASLWAVSFSLFALNVFAQTCENEPTCESLGYIYNEKNCPKDSKTSLRCPLDLSAYWCKDPIPPACSDGGFVDTCPSGQTGTQVAYSGLTCYKNCKGMEVGMILYSDKTVSTEVISGKTPIGVVFDVEKKLALALENASSLLEWGGFPIDVSTLEDCTSKSILSSCGTDGKDNTAKIIAYGQANNISYPAAEYCNKYTTAGTSAGDWFLPSLAELKVIWTNENTINTTLTKLGKSSLIASSLTETYYLSSTEYDYFSSWWLRMGEANELGEAKIGDDPKDGKHYHIRPVIAF